MSEPNPELEPDAPDWSNEPASDELLAEQLQERGMNMGEVQEEQGTPPTEDVPAPPDSPGTPMPDTSPPEESEGENDGEEEDDSA